jgi:hypothetical protein
LRCDPFDFDKLQNNVMAALDEHASGGYVDYRFVGELFEEVNRSVPVNWGTNCTRKRGFFELLSTMSGGAS